MSQAASNKQDDQDWSGERTITEYFPAMSESGALYKLAGSIPFGLGLLLYAPAYVIRALNPFSLIRYTLTDRRVRVDKGTLKRTVQYVALEDIDEIRVANTVKFTRTGDLEIISRGEVVLAMVGIQDPEPARHTIWEAAQSRVQMNAVLQRQRELHEQALAASA